MTATSPVLPARTPDSRAASLLAESAAAVDGGVMTHREFFRWLDERREEQAQRVERVPFEALRGWDFDPRTGDLRHATGGFFSIRGLRVRSGFGPVREWSQPVILQPEIGMLGIAVREFGGVLHLLMQAKSEPGNVNGVQLSPTVQATKSNYTRLHGGSAVPYLDSFRVPDPRKVVADVLQSEQGSWFLHKRNRNMVVEVGPEVEAGRDFCWLTLGQVNALLHHDNLVNMDARTVLSCLPDWRYASGDSARDHTSALHKDLEIRSWITRRRAEHDGAVELIPLKDAEGWRRSGDALSHARGLFFSIVGVDVSSGRREVPAWTQPLLQPHGTGIAALLVRNIGGVRHALLRARAEPGFLDVVELGPTVQCAPENYAHLPPADQPPYLEEVLRRRSAGVLYDTALSEEGGRFRNAQSRYMIIEVEEDFPTSAAEDFRWVTPWQLDALLKYSHHLNVQARTLVAALRTL
ncbi:NDP-hexose 2,3-dehydratase family protein [Streptomyces sporangiiformans]|uniref:NDP-hexose 2,3-dehydratase n=1 Tax=Streptomyces sporangiiformans TaxID=2315329 RepID=A0A505DHY7_9ACTN|nr:NDP-hexose 2,3-dehydratase family protein [Streptomyces sporangiiformans]TPQ22610.1 NDP-hexose 2,3-dehydratase [Streptomyces sporangiiformans]